MAHENLREVWTAPALDVVDEFDGAYVAEVYDNGVCYYRANQVVPATAEPFCDPTGYAVVRDYWFPRMWSNIDHVRALAENELRDLGYVRMV